VVGEIKAVERQMVKSPAMNHHLPRNGKFILLSDILISKLGVVIIDPFKGT